MPSNSLFSARRASDQESTESTTSPVYEQSNRSFAVLQKEHNKRLETKNGKETAASKRRSWLNLRPKSETSIATLQASKPRRPSSQEPENGSESALSTAAPTSRKKSTPQPEEQEPWVHKEQPLQLSATTTISTTTHQQERKHSPTPSSHTRLPTCLRPGPRVRSHPIHREVSIDRGIQSASPPTTTALAPLLEDDEVHPTISPTEIEESHEQEHQLDHQQQAPRLSRRPTRYYPVALALSDLPIPAPDIAAQFPDDALRAEIAALRLRVAELESKLEVKEREKREEVQREDGKWAARVRRLERERDALLAERAQARTHAGVAMGRAESPSSSERNGIHEAEAETEKWWEW